MEASKNLAFLAFASPSALCGPQSTHFERLNGVFQIVNWRCRAGKMQDVIERPIDVNIVGDIELDERKIAIAD